MQIKKLKNSSKSSFFFKFQTDTRVLSTSFVLSLFNRSNKINLIDVLKIRDKKRNLKYNMNIFLFSFKNETNSKNLTKNKNNLVFKKVHFKTETRVFQKNKF